MKKILFLLFIISLCLSVNAQLLWRVSGKDLKEPSYLFGTHHLAPLSVLDEITGFWEAFDGTSQVIGELVMSDMMTPESMQIMQSEMIIKCDTTFQSLFTKNEYDLISGKIQEYLNFDIKMVPQIKPSFITNNLVVAIHAENFPTFNPMDQLDGYLQRVGLEKDKKVNSLETMQFQCDMLFNSSSLTRQAELLLCTLNHIDEVIKQSGDLANAYMDRKLDLVEQIAYKNDGTRCDPLPGEMEIMNDNRNIKWAEKLPDMIKDTPSFIVVGALHLTGNNGLVKLLKQAGYTVEPVV